MKLNTIDEFDFLKNSFFKEVNIFKNELLEQSAVNAPGHYSEWLISHSDEQIVFLRDELKKDQFIHSLLEQLSMCNDTMKISQELSKDNTKSFEEKSVSKENENEKTATTGYKEKEKAITSNETSSETINRKTDDV